MATRISHSAVNTYSQCAKRYKLHYIDRIRPILQPIFFVFGSALDYALNNLLESKNVEESIKLFDKSFRFGNINNEPQYIPDNINIVYAKRDFDSDLLVEDDYLKYNELKEKLNLKSETKLEDDVAYFLDIKEKNGLKGLTVDERKLYNMANWLCMRRKGHVMIQSYAKEILPKINKVITIQKKINLTNDEGDVVTGALDLAVEWIDGKRYILDNKTSYKEYEPDSAMRSQQLIVYHHAEKEELKLDGVGFIVMYKQILKNKTKKCLSCGKDGTGQRHKTCDAVVDEKRCNGEWLEKIKPECRIEIILNEVTEAAENLVIQTFDESNEGIKKGVFSPNLNACSMGAEWKCAYYNLCWKGSKEDLVTLDNKI